MCGISGIISHNIENKSKLLKMSNSINHRGPDFNSIWISENKNVGFAHNRLSIIDLSNNANQPMLCQNNRFVLSFNGEIYNYKILKKEIEQSFKINWKSSSDTEVLLEFISNFGLNKTLKMINGMYAFSVFDKEKNITYLCRDRLGEKPLYYSLKNDEFIFSSELKAISSVINIKKISKKGMNYYFKYGFIPSPHSIYDNIYKLEPGKYIEICLKDNLDYKIFEHYSFIKEKYKNHNKLSQNSINKNAKLLSDELDNSVESELISDVPIGVLLSGGIDSSIIASSASIISKKKINTFTLGSNDNIHDETDAAKKISEYLGTKHHILKVNSSDFLKNFIQYKKIYDEPFSDSSHLITYLLCKETKKYVKVALTGDGGDELFGGYNRHIYSAKKINPIQKNIVSSIISKNSFLFEKIYYFINHIFKNREIHSDLSIKINKFSKFLSAKNFDQAYDTLLAINNQHFRIIRDNNYTDVKHIYNLDNQDIKLTKSELFMLLDSIFYLPENILFKMDRASMINSLETRAPFLNNNIVSISHQIPLKQKINNGKGKYILRTILENRMQPNLIKNIKKGFSIPLNSWINNDLKELILDTLDKKNLYDQGFFDFNSVQKIINDHYSKKINHTLIIWNLFNYMIWKKN